MAGWVRIICNRTAGGIRVSGDCSGLLGVPLEILQSAIDPGPLLPAVVKEALEDPSRPLREDRQAGLMVTAGEAGREVILVVTEIPTEADPVYPDLPAGVLSLDHSGIIRYYNRLLAEMFGMAASGCVGSDVAKVLPQPVLYNWSSVIKSAMMGHQVKVEFLPVAGRKNSGILARGGAGIVGLFLDFTETLETEKRFRAVQKMNQAILSAGDSGILMFDGKGRILLANRAMGRIAGQNSSLVGMHISNVFADECLSWVDRSAKRLLARPGKRIASGDMEWPGSSGETRIVRLSLQSITDDSGVVTHIVGYVDDVTEKVRGAKRLESLGRSLDLMAGLAGPAPGPGRRNTGSAALIREILEADVLAIYVNDPFSGAILSDSDGSWPEGLPPADFQELRFPAITCGEEGLMQLTGDGAGILRGCFDEILAYPLVNAGLSLGCIIVAYSSGGREAMHRKASVGELSTALLASGLALNRERGEVERLSGMLRGRDLFLEDLFGKLPCPAVLFSESGGIRLWNDEMTLLFGENPMALAGNLQQRFLERLLSGFGGVTGVLKRLSRGEAVIQDRLYPGNREGGAGPLFQVRKVDPLLQGSDESHFLAVQASSEDGPSRVPGSTVLLETIAGLYESLEPTQVLRRAALGAMKLTGASAAGVEVVGVGRVRVPDDGWTGAADWEAVITLEGDRAVFQFLGGGRTGLLEQLGKVLLRITGRLMSVVSPAVLERITGIPGGLVVVSDGGGRVLFANWPEVVFGESRFVLMKDLFREQPSRDVLISLKTAGKAVWRDSGVGLIQGVSLAGGASDRILWFPVGSDDDSAGDSKVGEVVPALVDALLSYARRARASLDSLARMLDGRDALNGVVTTLALDHAAAGEVLEVLKVVGASIGARSRPVNPEECLNTAAGLVRNAGERVPEVTLRGELPEVLIDPEWTSRVLARLLMMVREGQVTARSDGRWVVLDIPAGLDDEIPAAHGTCLVPSLSEDGTIGPVAEAGILAALLHRQECRLERGQSGSLRLYLPVVD